MFACRAGGDGNQRVCVIGRGNSDRVKIRLIQHAAVVCKTLDRMPGTLGRKRCLFLQNPLIDITNRGDMQAKVIKKSAPTASQADDSHTNSIVGLGRLLGFGGFYIFLHGPDA